MGGPCRNRRRKVETIFPGMDPYLEVIHLWPDVQATLSATIANQIQPLLSPKYVAVHVPYIGIEFVPMRISRPKTPMVGIELMEFPTRYHSIEIRLVGDEPVVTAIEILSPVNKRPGADAADAYERKRREIFNSDAHLLE